MLRPAPWVAALAGLLVFVPCAAASAQSDTSIDVQTRWPSPGPGRFGFVRDVATAPHLALGFGASAEYLHRPLVLVDTTAGDEELDGVGHHVTAEFLWSLGLFDFLQVGLALPVTLVQDGEGAQPATLSEADALPTTASRDVRVELAWDVLRTFRRRAPRLETDHGTGLLVSAGLTLPSGDERAFNGDDGVVFVPALTGGYRVGPVLLGATLDARIRSTSRFGLDGVVGSQLGIAAGASLELLPTRRLELSAEGRALVALVEDGASPIELMGGARYTTDRARDVSIAVRAGAGVTDDITSAAFRALVEVRYAPAGLDGDSDGVPDADDQCIDEPEDRDEFDDEDGCPDQDNDDDRVEDSVDRCDEQPEDHDEFQDDDGCPEADNDDDGLADGEDTCTTQAEDRDGFRDDDGCPDPDNDEDRRLDADDRCDDQPEDWDSFEDEDGCPDPDNDQDGIPDGNDRCTNEPEDRDGHEDTDGCPERDVDSDGIADAEDRCPTDPEDYNLVDDADGCPERRGEARARWVDDRLVVSGRVPQFARGSDVLPRALVPLVPAIARLVHGTACRHRVVIETTVAPSAPARPGQAAAAEPLSQRRARRLMEALVANGVPASLIATAHDAAAQPGGVTWTIRRDQPSELPRAECRGAPATPPVPAAGATPAPATSP
ncbi:MAG: thrombospondin [Deltaproteobacteria bacterium]|nr:thrombospondin [Deltaproteobacteria bacterium]